MKPIGWVDGAKPADAHPEEAHRSRVSRMSTSSTQVGYSRLEVSVSRMAAGSVSLVAVLRDARTAVKLAQTA